MTKELAPRRGFEPPTFRLTARSPTVTAARTLICTCGSQNEIAVDVEELMNQQLLQDLGQQEGVVLYQFLESVDSLGCCAARSNSSKWLMSDTVTVESLLYSATDIVEPLGGNSVWFRSTTTKSPALELRSEIFRAHQEHKRSSRAHQIH